MELYFRKLVLLEFLIALYVGVCFWVPYSKKWLLDDVINNQARLYFATQSQQNLRDNIIGKAESLGIPLKPDQITVQNINGEIIYIELDLIVPYNILTYNSTLHFQPKVFGLIRGFNFAGSSVGADANIDQTLTSLSDSTKQYLRSRTLRNYFDEFFAH
jgi:hypothetical protein